MTCIEGHRESTSAGATSVAGNHSAVSAALPRSLPRQGLGSNTAGEGQITPVYGACQGPNTIYCTLFSDALHFALSCCITAFYRVSRVCCRLLLIFSGRNRAVPPLARGRCDKPLLHFGWKEMAIKTATYCFRMYAPLWPETMPQSGAKLWISVEAVENRGPLRWFRRRTQIPPGACSANRMGNPVGSALAALF